MATPQSPEGGVQGDRVDPRVLRTRALLQQALLDLARERSLDEIAVADVAERATVNRSTFYQHYADTDTLLADALDTRAAQAGADLSDIDPSAPVQTVPAALVRYAEHVAAHADLYRRALGDRGSPAAVTRLRRRIEQLALDGIEMHGTTTRLSALPRSVAAGALAGAVIGVLTAWLDRDPLPLASDAARWAWAAANGWDPGGEAR